MRPGSTLTIRSLKIHSQHSISPVISLSGVNARVNVLGRVFGEEGEGNTHGRLGIPARRYYSFMYFLEKKM